MTTLNCYATLAEYKSFVTSRGQTASVDATDDALIEVLLKSASNYINTQTSRHFYPYIQTRYFDVPKTEESLDMRELKMDDDLLEVLSVTNGDDVVIPSTEYTIRPRNASPYKWIRLDDASTYYWATDGSGNSHDVIAVSAIWGCHNHYAQAWLLGSTLAEALDTSETGIDVTSGALFSVGDLIRFENEFGYVSAVVTNTLTNTRGENGSTAAIHVTAGNVYIWQVMEEVKTAVLEIAMQANKRRFGQSNSNIQTITSAGVVLTPRDIPAMAVDFIRTYRRYS